MACTAVVIFSPFPHDPPTHPLPVAQSPASDNRGVYCRQGWWPAGISHECVHAMSRVRQKLQGHPLPHRCIDAFLNGMSSVRSRSPWSHSIPIGSWSLLSYRQHRPSSPKLLERSCSTRYLQGQHSVEMRRTSRSKWTPRHWTVSSVPRQISVPGQFPVTRPRKGRD